MAPGCPPWAQLGERAYVADDGLYGVGNAEAMREELARPAADNRARAELARGLGDEGSNFAAETLLGAELVERCVDARGATHSLMRVVMTTRPEPPPPPTEPPQGPAVETPPPPPTEPPQGPAVETPPVPEGSGAAPPAEVAPEDRD